MTDKTETERLRKLLDKLKEAYHQELDDFADCSRQGSIRCMEFGSCYACMGGTIEAIEQAVEATLGRDQPIVRCRDCKHSLLFGTECRHFAAYEPIAGGDEYEEVTYSVSPDGFCAWGERRAEQ